MAGAGVRAGAGAGTNVIAAATTTAFASAISAAPAAAAAADTRQHHIEVDLDGHPALVWRLSLNVDVLSPLDPLRGHLAHLVLVAAQPVLCVLFVGSNGVKRDGGWSEF